jgi:enoyl-CoA hydratase/carnithine racemase
MTVELDLTGGVATLTLARPERHNAFDQAMSDALAARVRDVERSDARAIVIFGRGRSFSSGADLTMLAALDGEGLRRFMLDTTASFRRLARLPAPVIAAVAGYCLGGGFELALHCDAIVAADDCVFGFPETLLGLVTTCGSVVRLIEAVGALRAKEVLLFGRRVAAQEARAMGLVREVVPTAELLDVANRFARGIAAAPRGGITAMKQLIAAATEQRASASFVAELEAFTRLVHAKKGES